MKNLADARPARCPTGDSGDYVTRTFCSEVANTDDPFRFKDANDFAQMFIARDEQWSALARRQFVRSSIASARLDKRERAVIHHQVFLEELIGRAKAFREQSPQTLAADFAPSAIEAHHRPFGMLGRGSLNRGLNAKPIAHCRDFPEWDTGLHHTKRTGIHSEEEHAFATIGIASQVNLVRTPGVNERIVNARHRRRELQCFNSIAKTSRRDD